MGKINKKNKKNSGPKNRKELRKEKRLKKKDNKREFFSKKKNFKKGDSKTKKETQNNQIKEIDDIEINDNHDNEIESDFELSDDELNSKISLISKKSKKLIKGEAQKSSKTIGTNDRFLENQQREKKKQNELQKKMKKQRILQLKEANEDEDRTIKKLEKKLRINKHANDKSIHNMFNDGLDYALELCLPDNINKMYSAAKEAVKIQENESEDDFQDDLDIALGEKKDKFKKNDTQLKKSKSELESVKKKQVILKNVESKYFKDDDSDLSDADSELDMSEESNNDQSESEINENKDSENISNEESNISSEDSEEEGTIENKSESDPEENYGKNHLSEDSVENYESNQNSENKMNDEDVKIWEDIYGRKRDAEGNVLQVNTGKYVPPHLRTRLDTEKLSDPKIKEKIDKLKRQVKGLLNRLTEANMIKISKEIENLYRNNSRFHMNNIFSELLMDALVTNVLSKERLVLEYTMLIAILHVNVGSEISAHILQELIVKFDNLLEKIENLDVENKELDNIIYVVSHMYTYKIFQHSLIFEILKKLIEKLCEKSVECILLIFKSIGFQLRKEDPLALRDIILAIQKRSTELKDMQNNSRYKFMIEILTAIKNNNMQKIPQYDPTLAEHLKKVLKSMLTNGKYLSALNITIDDLLNADKKGKWWVVGSAWTGNVKDIGVACNKEDKKNGTNEENFTEQLLELAKKQRMNTEDRRNIFCVIMSSEDYLDAFEKLLRLSIKDVRLIVSIIIHCCLSENNFNPYYAVLSEKFCSHDRKYFLATQFAVWDKIKDIDLLSKQQIENLAKYVLYLIRKGAQSISILKVIEFTELNKTTLRFVRIIILALLLGDKNEMLQVFKRIAPSIALSQFKNAIMLFIKHFLLKGSEKSHVPEDKLELLNERINEVEEIIFNKSFI